MTERLYYHDANLQTFTGQVIDLTSVHGKPAVVLNQTAFYPTSGGQPHDRGLLDDIPVIDVIDEGERILHVIEGLAPVIGSTVRGRIDVERRTDHRQQHSGQHVLSQAFEQVGGGRTIAFHLGAAITTIDLDHPRLDAGIAQTAERLANRVVLEDRSVVIHFAHHDDLERFGLRKPSERTGLVRIIEIEGFDRSACGGTHVTRTGQIGPIKIRRWERRGETTRVEFLAGWRALNDYAGRLETTRFLAERLSVKDTDLAAAVGRVIDESSLLRDEVNQLKERMLSDEAEARLSQAEPLPGGAGRLVCGIFEARTPAELKRLALTLTARGPVIVLLGSNDPTPGGRSHLIFAQTPGLPFDLSVVLRQVGPPIGLRGGGSRDLAQGGTNASRIDPAIEAAKAMLTN